MLIHVFPISNHLGLKGSSRISSGVQVELSSNVGQISPSNWQYVLREDPGHDPQLPAHTWWHLLEEGYILAENLLPHRRQRTSQAIYKVVVTGSWKKPRELHTGVPRPVHLSCWSCHVTKQIPSHWTIEVASISLYSTQDLAGVGKSKHFSEIWFMWGRHNFWWHNHPTHISVHPSAARLSACPL